jgi:hypothetical protein
MRRFIEFVRRLVAHEDDTLDLNEALALDWRDVLKRCHAPELRSAVEGPLGHVDRSGLIWLILNTVIAVSVSFRSKHGMLPLAGGRIGHNILKYGDNLCAVSGRILSRIVRQAVGGHCAIMRGECSAGLAPSTVPGDESSVNFGVVLRRSRPDTDMDRRLKHRCGGAA